MTTLAFDQSDTAEYKLPVNDEVAVPRTATPGYRFPPAAPELAADRCSRDDLLDIAAGAVRQRDQLWALVGSQDHVQAICDDYGKLAVEHKDLRENNDEQFAAIVTLKRELAFQQGIGLEFKRKSERNEQCVVHTTNELYATKRELAQTEELRLAEMQEGERLRGLLRLQSEELAVTRQAMAEMARRFHDARTK